MLAFFIAHGFPYALIVSGSRLLSPSLVYCLLAYARSVRTDTFGIHATHLGQENLVNAEKKEKVIKDDEGAQLVSMDYTAPRRKPPIHN